MRDELSRCVAELQDRITARLEALDGCRFQEDMWERHGGGGGCTRVLEQGTVFEKAGVNFSAVHGAMSSNLARAISRQSEQPSGRAEVGAARTHGEHAETGGDLPDGEAPPFYATGISLVVHPRNPRVPTVHANFRYLEQGETCWLGGGADLTPYYLYEEDAIHFHRVWKDVCDRHDATYYPRFKRQCDEYFFLPHRGEARGIGGIFFDYLPVDAGNIAFWKDAGAAFLDAYVPIVERRRDEETNQRERRHQLRRRGRYVEFNLVYDRGTVFGLKTAGRIESILMSLPPFVRWDYDRRPEPGSAEEKLLDVLRTPRDWLGMSEAFEADSPREETRDES